ncbi:hypothetical protein DICVIV_08800 [Dictyocaulus viviparus]|uniref:PDEase domain-containing protein n=1 Tax=Dictyocaulus viviparus TaxID=29172 RepID=A0A0D8XKJ2_DICVI|nr:hypothetical protein DICVIV_08800 [Dictyocaulus viviparus]
MELFNESDRLLMAKMVIKMADINSPTKPYSLHRQWTERICEEFYEQGDEERRLGMPITQYMDRNDAQVAKLQDSFIAHVVSPLAVAMNEAGLLPILPGLVEPEMMINLKHNHQKWLQEIDDNPGETGEILRDQLVLNNTCRMLYILDLIVEKSLGSYVSNTLSQSCSFL